MTTSAPDRRDHIVRAVRLISGCVLFAYIVGHLLNLALGLISLEAMDAWRGVFMAPWHNPIGLPLLYLSIAAHMMLGLHALYRRRTLRMNGFDAAQLLMAVALPPLMIAHLNGTRGLAQMVDFEPSYAWLMVVFWVWSPGSGLRQVAVLMVAWIHGCMGLYYWLRLQVWWPRWQTWLYPLVFIVPVLALLGFVEGGKDALRLADDPAWMDRILAGTAVITDDVIADLRVIEYRFVMSYVAIVAMVLIARAIRQRLNNTGGPVTIEYRGGPSVSAKRGLSLLEISMRNHVPHAHVCNGRGRCGTCRVRIDQGIDSLPAATSMEQMTLDRVGAPANVRLACQVVPGEHSITVTRLIDPLAELEAVHEPEQDSGDAEHA